MVLALTHCHSEDCQRQEDLQKAGAQLSQHHLSDIVEALACCFEIRCWSGQRSQLRWQWIPSFVWEAISTLTAGISKVQPIELKGGAT